MSTVLCPAHTISHCANLKSIMEGKTIAHEVISVQPHPPDSNYAAKHVKENQRLCKAGLSNSGNTAALTTLIGSCRVYPCLH